MSELQIELPARLSQGQHDCWTLLTRLRPLYNHHDPEVSDLAHAAAMNVYRAMQAMAALEKLTGEEVDG